MSIWSSSLRIKKWSGAMAKTITQLLPWNRRWIADFGDRDCQCRPEPRHQGPPGTGKSQTIANIIAAAAYDGKSVLFIAEKMVALKVVHDRLKNAGLGALCLQLHSNKANKRGLTEELKQTLSSGAAEPSPADITPRQRE
jgi:hypothetical protein